MNPSKATRAISAKRGFVLIVTLSLMILLTIIAVGLLTLSSITLRSSAQGQAAAEARANARLALMMAIGELQKQMGPDSRISAPSDAGSVATSGQPHWTAVYDAWKWNDNSSTPETPQSRAPKFRRWLVSGANAASGAPAGTAEILLVGSKSLSASGQPLDQIKAPMLPVNRGNSKGMIAWWTSDESTKAKINAGGGASVASNPLFDSQSPRYVGHKAITELKSFDWKPGQRSAVVSTASTNLAAGLGTGGLGRFSHDVTVYSNGVIADVRAGRLKRDLSNLLSRPITELENKPLYLANGRMNRFDITNAGVISNMPGLPTNAAGANRWGINLEELHLFHEIHREVDWSNGKPKLASKGSQSDILNDRFFMYRIPTLEAVSLILAFIASPEAGTAPVTYRIDATMDVIVALSNPNDIPTVWSASVPFRTETEGFPYTPKWNIQRPGRTPSVPAITHTVQAINSGLFKSSILGGFTLEAGEAAVFGASVTDTSSESVNLTRGYAPRGGLSISDRRWDSNNNWDPAVDGLRATGLRPTDQMDLTMVPIGSGLGGTPSGWISNYAKIGSSGVKIRTYEFGGGGGSAMTTAPMNIYMPSSIKPQATSMPTVQEFIGKPMPVVMVTTLTNVERSRTSLQPPNALTSRPYLMHEPATSKMVSLTNSSANFLPTMHNSQLLTIAEPMDYKFGNDRTMADSTGQNAYHGGAREPGLLGGNKQVVKRRIPLAPPISLGAFENAIACGFNSRFTGSSALNGNTNDASVKNQNADPNIDPDNLPTLPNAKFTGTGWEPRATIVTLAKSIGNSWTNPFLSSGLVQDGTYHDQSWMANTALWDSWFLGGIVKPGPSAAWNSDIRSQKQQFMDLAARTANLRNTRLTFHPHKSATEALAELFNGDNLKPEAINKLTKYLLVDGAFNVNSTSETAWKAFLTSVRDQQLLDANGTASKKTHPFGTLGYAVKSATSGAEGDWAGFRDLSDSELERIAKAIVTEVKARGPFLNLADFINRRPNSSDATQRALGALQAAIDKSGINSRFTTAGRKLDPADVPMFAGKDTLASEPAPARGVGAAGFLSQGALLTAFGSQITVRGDTFVIRTYGDFRDAAGNLQARAWCEAVVQRTPEFVDPTNPPEASASLSAVNTAFGRKFNIVSFRWLSPDEI
jgi:Tfp pilus assembly protein PilX